MVVDPSTIPLRVAHITAVYPPICGGIGAVAEEYARGLAARGLAVEVLTPDYGGGKRKEERGKSEGVTQLRPLYAWGFAALVPQLLWQLRRFDVIHLHHPFYGGEEAAALASWFWRIPLVVTYHMQPKASGWVGAIMRWHRRLVEPFILRQAKIILVSSRDYANETIVSNDTLVSFETRVSEMPFGVDTTRFRPGRDDAFRAEHGVPADAMTIIFVGGLDDAHYFKGLPILLTALQHVDAHLIVIGEGNRRLTYQAQATSLGLAARVHFAGAVSTADLPRAYRAADLHVLASIDRSEAFGLVTLEAMASGIPSVVSNLPGMRSLIVPGETGLLTPAADTKALAQRLQELLQQNGSRQAMGEAARRRAVAEYDAETLLDRLLRLYCDLRPAIGEKSA